MRPRLRPDRMRHRIEHRNERLALVVEANVVTMIDKVHQTHACGTWREPCIARGGCVLASAQGGIGVLVERLRGGLGSLTGLGFSSRCVALTDEIADFDAAWE